MQLDARRPPRGCLKSPYDPRLSDPSGQEAACDPIPPRLRHRLTDAEWRLLASLVPAAKPGGRPPLHDRRELVNAMAIGCGPAAPGGCCPLTCRPGRPSPTTAAPGGNRGGGNRSMPPSALRSGSARAGAHPSAAILDSQSVKTTQRGASTVTTAPRRSTAASATCWSTPSAWSARSRRPPSVPPVAARLGR